ncbi:MAG: hypothetical protein IT410_00115 [Candidatus Doudnabacteria bacterium]|nr:hypothetical protein [Candidatus Doudnabacteria bacterium]
MDRSCFVAIFKQNCVTSVDAFVLSCIEYRIGKAVPNFLIETLGVSYTMKEAAGGVREINAGDEKICEWILMNVGIGVDKHGAAKVVLINHTDCAAYKAYVKFASEAEEILFHTEELRKAADRLRESFPNMVIEAYIAVLLETSEVGFLYVDVSPRNVNDDRAVSASS